MNKKQITLRLPDEVYGALRDESEKSGMSINEIILLRINPLKFECSELKSCHV